MTPPSASRTPPQLRWGGSPKLPARGSPHPGPALAARFHRMLIRPQPRPEEARRAVSKGGDTPSLSPILRDAALRAAPQDEVVCDPTFSAVGWRSPRLERLRVSPSTQGVGGGRVFQSGGDAEEGRAAPLMLLFAEHEARQ